MWCVYVKKVGKGGRRKERRRAYLAATTTTTMYARFPPSSPQGDQGGRDREREGGGEASKK